VIPMYEMRVMNQMQIETFHKNANAEVGIIYSFLGSL